MNKKRALQELAKVAEGMYLETGIINSRDERYKDARLRCINLGATAEEITSVGDAIMNKHYMKGSRYYIPAHMKQILDPVLAAV